MPAPATKKPRKRKSRVVEGQAKQKCMGCAALQKEVKLLRREKAELDRENDELYDIVRPFMEGLGNLVALMEKEGRA